MEPATAPLGERGRTNPPRCAELGVMPGASRWIPRGKGMHAPKLHSLCKLLGAASQAAVASPTAPQMRPGKFPRVEVNRPENALCLDLRPCLPGSGERAERSGLNQGWRGSREKTASENAYFWASYALRPSSSMRRERAATSSSLGTGWCRCNPATNHFGVKDFAEAARGEPAAIGA